MSVEVEVKMTVKMGSMDEATELLSLVRSIGEVRKFHAHTVLTFPYGGGGGGGRMTFPPGTDSDE